MAVITVITSQPVQPFLIDKLKRLPFERVGVFFRPPRLEEEANLPNSSAYQRQ